MFGNTRNLQSITTYEQALKYFTSEPLPTYRTRRVWADNERPLGNKRQPHYKLVKGDGYFDVVLYNQVMARFHARDADGFSLCQYSYDDRVTSQSFMCYVLGVSECSYWNTLDDKRIIVPILGGLDDCKLMVDKHGRVDVSRSDHVQLHSKVSGKEDRARNKEIRDFFRPYTTLAMFRLHEYIDKFHFDYNSSYAFGNGNCIDWVERDLMRAFFKQNTGEAQTKGIDHLLNVSAQAVVDSMMAKRGYGYYISRGYVRPGLVTSTTDYIRAKLSENNKIPTERELEKALLDRMVRCIGKQVTGRKLIPKFCDSRDFPRHNYHV